MCIGLVLDMIDVAVWWCGGAHVGVVKGRWVGGRVGFPILPRY